MNGLSQKFTLTQGKFTFASDETKARDNLAFFMGFNFISRIYLPSFNPDLMWLVQKPASRILLFKTLILGGLNKKIALHVPRIKIGSSELVFSRGDKKYLLVLNFKYDQPDSEQQQLVTFV